MKHTHDYDSIVACVVEKRIRKSMDEDATEGPMNDLKRQRAFAGERDCVVNATDKVRCQLK